MLIIIHKVGKVASVNQITSTHHTVCESGHKHQSACQLEIFLEQEQGSGFGDQQYKLSVSSLILPHGSFP